MASQQPPLDERELRKQQIRPRFLDLAEFDDDVPDDPRSRRAALDSFSNWPPAATVVRKKPPPIASSSRSQASTTGARRDISRPKQPTVENEEENEASTPAAAIIHDKAPRGSEQAQTQSRPKTVRFGADTKAEDDQEESAPAAPRPTLNLAGSIIGSISERPVGERRSKPTRSKPSGSRFVVRKRMDEDLQKHEEQRQQRLRAEAIPDGQEPGTGFPVVSHRDQIAPILPPSSDKSRAFQYSEDIETVEAPQRDTLATQAALSEPSAPSSRGSISGITSTAKGKAQPATEDEEWLDEDGRPMSAFRKSRLLRQGLRPPSVRSKSSQAADSVATTGSARSFVPDPTRDPGGGADIDAITAVLSDVSRENDQKLRQMSAAEISDELRSLESLFGKDVLEALRNRKGASALQTSADEGPTAPAAQTRSVPESGTDAQALAEDEEGPLAIKRQYFPAEPEGPNPSLEWMMPQHSAQAASSDLRFDFSGHVIRRDVQNDETYLSGLHHHGDDQEAPGYTFAELIHLSRSTVAAQRQLALNVLGRVCELHPAFDQSGDYRDAAAIKALNDHALLLRARAITISRWLLEDRHFTVRAAALRCLTSAIRSLPSGISLPLGTGQELDFGRLVGDAVKADAGDRDGDAEASEVEKAMQKDWAKVLLESNVVNLFLDRTDSVITSTWEAELALELLYRIASCSATHASQVFEDDSKKLCDFVVHLGLKVAWPPSSTEAALPATSASRSSSMPSLTAVRLLHQGILSDREVAKAIVSSGSVEHLLRFVVTQPWKVENDSATNDDAGDEVVMMAYRIFDEVLHLFASLASYGLFASIVARTWNLWQETSMWAINQLMGKQDATAQPATKTWIREARSTAVQRIFEVLAEWTHCAMDPHELATAHDITWTQVRDWIEPIKDAAQGISSSHESPKWTQTSALGALCAYIDAWLRCAIRKEPDLLQKHLDFCAVVVSQCQQPIQHHFLKVLRLFSSAPTQAMALDEAEEACHACHKYLDLSRTILHARQTLSKQAGPEAGQIAHDGTSMLQEGLALVSCAPVWEALQSPESQASGRHVYGRTFSDFIAAVLIAHPDAASKTALELVAITRLDARHASRVADIVLRTTETLSGAATTRVLRPFLLECVIGSNHLPEGALTRTVEHRDPTPLSKVASLFKSRTTGSVDSPARTSREEADDDEEEENDDKDVDPITGSKLWKCPANGLPIRPDWPLLAMDDLLHSANTAVFNRPNNLDKDWKPSELEMVRASLQLAVAVFRSQLDGSKQATAGGSTEADEALLEIQARAMLGSLPSPEQILLGVMKVFMLEKDQADTFTDKTAAGVAQQKQSGVLTGRDLFRDSAISQELTSLLDIADELVQLRRSHFDSGVMSTITLDAWTASTYSGSMSFYQFFTDLVALWDSISFGDANFARVVMTVANAGCTGGVFEGQDGMAVDFRRMVWNDYSDSLRSMPPTKVPKWLLGWEDTDADMLQHYCRYLVSVAGMSAARESIAWQIARHHVSAAMRSLNGTGRDTSKVASTKHGKRVETILKSLYVAKGESLLRELLEVRVDDPSASKLSDEEIQRLVARFSR